MKYRIYKQFDDGHTYSAGILMSDGCYRIVSLSRQNWPYIEALQSKHGYIIEELPDDWKQPPGLYDETNDKQVDEEVALALTLGRADGHKYLTEKQIKDYVCPTLSLGVQPREYQAARRKGGKMRDDQVKREVERSRAQGLRDAGGMLGMSAGAAPGEVEAELRKVLGS